MRFLTSKFWVLAVFLALFGQFSPLAARFCSMTQSSTLCIEISAPTHDEKNESAQAMPCGHCCKQSESLIAILHSAPLLSASRQQLVVPHVEAAILPLSSSWDASPNRVEFQAVFHEIDLPPPLEGVGSTFSCRAPPVEV